MGSHADRTPTAVLGDVVDEWSDAWGVRVSWMPAGSVVWFPKVICRRDLDDPRRFTVPAWFDQQIALKVNCI